MRDRCREIRELIPEFVTGSLATDKMIAVSHHVGQCIPCREYLLGFEADDKMLCAFAEAMEPSVQRVEEQVLDALSRRRLARALGTLSVFRRVATSRVIKVSAAAVIAVAAGIGIALLLSKPIEKEGQVVVKKIEQQPGQMPAPAAVEQAPQGQADIARAKLEAELKRMEQMFAAGDVDGLVAMLSKGSLFGKVFAANYLARIGGLRAVAALEKAKDQYHWPDEDNPFAAAIDEIKSRAAAAKETTTMTEETITYRGIVTDANGAPIEAVDIRSDLYLYGLAQEFKPGEADSRTNSTGRFEIGPLSVIEKKGTHILVFEHPDYALGWFDTNWSKDVDPNTVQITLLGPTVVAGRVTDSHGNPVEGAMVAAQLQLRLARRFYYFNLSEFNKAAAETDAGGWFVFDKIPQPARLHISVSKAGYAQYTTRKPNSDHYPVRAGEEDLLIALEPGGAIRGRLLLDRTGYKKEGIWVTAKGPSGYGSGKTDEEGRFVVHGLPPEKYTVVANNAQLSKEGLVCSAVENVQVSLDTAPVVELKLMKGLPVMVKAVDEKTGEALGKVRVRVTLRDNKDLQVGWATTDENGSGVVKLTPGEYTVLAYGWKEGRSHEFSRDFSVEQDSEDLSVELAITPRPFVYGWLVDTEGRSVRGSVRIGWDDEVETNQEGGFEVPEPGPQQGSVYTGFAFDADNKLGKAFSWERGDDANDLEIVLEPLASIVGRVVDANGEGVPDVKLEVTFGQFLPGRSWPSVLPGRLKKTIEQDGRFSIEQVPVGLPMRVIIEKPGFERKETAVEELGSGQVAELEDIVLEALEGFKEGVVEWTGKLSGQVRDENDEPMVGIRVLAKAGGKGFNDSTDFKGRYMFTGLPKGKEIGLTVGTAEYGYNSFSAVCDGNDFDMQIFPEGYAPSGLEED